MIRGVKRKSFQVKMQNLRKIWKAIRFSFSRWFSLALLLLIRLLLIPLMNSSSVMKFSQSSVNYWNNLVPQKPFLWKKSKKFYKFKPLSGMRCFKSLYIKRSRNYYLGLTRNWIIQYDYWILLCIFAQTRLFFGHFDERSTFP